MASKLTHLTPEQTLVARKMVQQSFVRMTKGDGTSRRPCKGNKKVKAYRRIADKLSRLWGVEVSEFAVQRANIGRLCCDAMCWFSSLPTTPVKGTFDEKR